MFVPMQAGGMHACRQIADGLPELHQNKVQGKWFME
jgi:hypothetical protein